MNTNSATSSGSNNEYLQSLINSLPTNSNSGVTTNSQMTTSSASDLQSLMDALNTNTATLPTKSNNNYLQSLIQNDNSNSRASSIVSSTSSSSDVNDAAYDALLDQLGGGSTDDNSAFDSLLDILNQNSDVLQNDDTLTDDDGTTRRRLLEYGMNLYNPNPNYNYNNNNNNMMYDNYNYGMNTATYPNQAMYSNQYGNNNNNNMYEMNDNINSMNGMSGNINYMNQNTNSNGMNDAAVESLSDGELVSMLTSMMNDKGNNNLDVSNDGDVSSMMGLFGGGGNDDATSSNNDMSSIMALLGGTSDGNGKPTKIEPFHDPKVDEIEEMSFEDLDKELDMIKQKKDEKEKTVKEEKE